MKRILRILFCTIILASLAAPAVLADACQPRRPSDCRLSSDSQHAIRIEGKKARRQARARLYLKQLCGDKRAVYKEYGYTPNRLRVDQGWGEIVEIWTYHAEGLEFTFDAASRLIERHSIPKEDRRVTY